MESPIRPDIEERGEAVPRSRLAALSRRWAAFRTTKPYRAVRAVGLTIASAELLYLVLFHTFLWTGLLETLVSNSEKGRRVDVRSGWSVWPGDLHLKNLQLRMQDHNIQFQMGLDEVVVDVGLYALLKGTLRAERVRGSGLVFRFRHKVHDTKGKETRVAAYPSIEGFDDPPLYQGPEPPPIPDDKYDLWTIDLSDVDVGIREIWMNEYRYKGSARAVGGFRLRPERRLRVSPSHLSIGGGELSFGAAGLLATDLHGKATARVPSYDVRKPEGREVFSFVLGQVNLSASVVAVDPLSVYLDAIALSRGAGTASVHLNLDKGSLASGSRVDYRTSDVAVEKGPLRGRGDIEITLEAGEGEPEARELTAKLRAKELRLGPSHPRKDSPTAGVLLTEPRGVVRTNAAQIAGTWKIKSFAADVPKLEAKTVGWLTHIAGEDAKWHVKGGPVRGSARIASGPGAPTGSTALTLSDFEFAYHDIVLRMKHGKLGAKTTMDLQNDTGTAELEVFEARGATAGARDNLVEDWWMNANGEASYKGFPPRSFEAVVHAKFKNGSPILSVLGARDAIPGIVDDLVSLDGLKVGLGIVHDSDHTAVRVRYAESNLADVRGRWLKRGDATTAAFLIGGDVVSMGIRIEHDDVDFRLFADDKWLERQISP